VLAFCCGFGSSIEVVAISGAALLDLLFPHPWGGSHHKEVPRKHKERRTEENQSFD